MKIVPELNHDLFSFKKAMKDAWQMNGRWKEGGLMIELFKTTRASMKFDRMIPSGSSWLMGIRVQRVFDQAHTAMEPGKTIFISKFHQITGHTGEHPLKPTANYMKLRLIGRLPPCEVCAQAKIRQRNDQEQKLLMANFEVKAENPKVEGLITYSTDQQIFKFKVNSGTD